MNEVQPEVSELVKEAERDMNIPEHKTTQSGRTITCYNKACKDYRRERPYDEPCECKRPKIKGPAEMPIYF